MDDGKVPPHSNEEIQRNRIEIRHGEGWEDGS